MYNHSVIAGHWRSWLARFHGMEEVIGSNPICSTRKIIQEILGYFFLSGDDRCGQCRGQS